jgi:prepilin-type N-terminal cleavage/methylation domain-containing protein
MKNKTIGFTLIELLVVISIIGFVLSAAAYVFNSVRMQSRDTLRVGNISTLTKALALYLNDAGQFPVSNGECLSDASPIVAVALKNSKSIVFVPSDPMWPSTLPGSFHSGTDYAAGGAANFCYYYYSLNGSQFYLSYYLESNSKAGTIGIHVVTQSGNNAL